MLAVIAGEPRRHPHRASDYVAQRMSAGRAITTSAHSRPHDDFHGPSGRSSVLTRPALMRYDRARNHLDRHPNYILAAYMASGT